MGYDLRSQKATIYGTGDQRFQGTNGRQIGNAVALVLQHASEMQNRHVYVHSFAPAQNEILTALEKASGGRWDVMRSSVEALAKSGREKLANGDIGGAALQLISAGMYGYGDLNKFEDRALADMKVLGLQEEDMEATIIEVWQKVKTQSDKSLL